jgi:transcriptional regulator with XRE-family HTH domain
MFDYKNVGKRIQKYRLELGKTQEELAEDAETSKNYLSDIETGKVASRLNKYYDIAMALEVTLDMLVSDASDNISNKDQIYLNEISPLLFSLTIEQRKMLVEYLKLLGKYEVYKHNRHVYND